MRKGLNALELVFTMFVLIIVVLIVIKIFTEVVNPKKLPFKDFMESAQYQQERIRCKQICDEYSTTCDNRDAAKYCLEKVHLDIEGNKRPGEKGHYNFVMNLPYCEDGLYCFHIYDCRCGNYLLDAETCKKELCQYYMDRGMDPVAAMNVMKGLTGVNWGTCPEDPKDWKLNYIPPTNYKASWWWTNAGYDSNTCEEGVSVGGCDDYCDGIVYGGITYTRAYKNSCMSSMECAGNGASFGNGANPDKTFPCTGSGSDICCCIV